MTNQNAGNGQKKAKSDFVVACNSVKLAIKGKLARAHIVSTFDYQNKGFPKHSTYLIVDPNDTKVAQLANACRAIKQQFFPNMPDLLWNHPIKDARTPLKPDGTEWQDWQKGQVFIAVSTGTQFPPTALVKDAQSPKGYREATVLDERNFYFDGADAVVEFAAGGMEGNNKGINLYFNGILGLGTGERFVIASSGSFNADEAFGEFLKGTAGGADMNSTYNQGMNGQNQVNNNQNQNMGNGGGYDQGQNSTNTSNGGSHQQNGQNYQNQNNGGYAQNGQGQNNGQAGQNHNYNGNGQNMGNGQHNGMNHTGQQTTYHSNNNGQWNNNNGGGSLV